MSVKFVHILMPGRERDISERARDTLQNVRVSSYFVLLFQCTLYYFFFTCLSVYSVFVKCFKSFYFHPLHPPPHPPFLSLANQIVTEDLSYNMIVSYFAVLAELYVSRIQI